ncbi:radical SAM protein [Aestuariirhabdus sp. Z084]|nr:radical SAM protein [Aestuariirhabdus haliotis]MCL6418780.1 radical SAM protein [Aestuariirhabdus haliotis]
MYTAEGKQFRPKPIDQIEAELKGLTQHGYPVRRVFLADGDAMSLSFRRLKEILELIQRYYPDLNRVSSYCLPRNLKNKSVQEMSELHELGLKLLYVGCESGDDEVLRLVNKGETYDSSLAALSKIHQAGIKSSVMILNGLGGPELSGQHALNSARLMNASQPDYLSTLVVEFPMGSDRFAEPFEGRWRKLNKVELFQEMEVLLSTLELEKTIFRSDHASNYLVLKGVLGQDKSALLDKVRQAMANPQQAGLRQEWQRGL